MPGPTPGVTIVGQKPSHAEGEIDTASASPLDYDLRVGDLQDAPRTVHHVI